LLRRGTEGLLLRDFSDDAAAPGRLFYVFACGNRAFQIWFRHAFSVRGRGPGQKNSAFFALTREAYFYEFFGEYDGPGICFP
jgi:hypothetical protein